MIENKSWYKTWWGIVILILLLPFTLSYFIWKQSWKKEIKGALIGFVWIIFAITVAFSPDNSRQELATNNSVGKTGPSPTTAVISPAVTIQPSMTPVSYDSNRGNNWIAAKYAQQIMDTANKAVPDAVTDIRIDLAPEDINNKNEDEYKKSVTSVFVSIEVDYGLWDSFSDSEKKDVVASLVTSTRNIFSGSPHIKVSNGVRTVAEGEFSVLNQEPKITLK